MAMARKAEISGTAGIGFSMWIRPQGELLEVRQVHRCLGIIEPCQARRECGGCQDNVILVDALLLPDSERAR